MVPLSPQDQLRQQLRQRRRPGRKPGIQVDGQKISALIGERGYVAERVAEAAGCSAPTLSNLRSRYTRRVSQDLLARLAAVLEVDPAEITLAGEAGKKAA